MQGTPIDTAQALAKIDAFFEDELKLPRPLPNDHTNRLIHVNQDLQDMIPHGLPA
jgi:hypothetical protein